MKEIIMIVIDGRESEQALSNYANLEDALVKLSETESLSNRIITDVLVNEEAFSELYPHQAEDIAIEDVERLELVSVSVTEMAKDIIAELPKVIKILNVSSKSIATLFRDSEIDDALDSLQDMLTVGSDFIKTIQVIRYYFSIDQANELLQISDSLDPLLTELSESIEDEDWMLVADLLEFELIPATEGWLKIISLTGQDVNSHKA